MIPKWSVAVKKSEANALSTTARMCAAFRSDSAKYFCVVLSETGPDHLHVIAEEVSRVAELCIGQDVGTMSTAMAFMNMEAGCREIYRIPPMENGVTGTPELKYSDSGTSY